AESDQNLNQAFELARTARSLALQRENNFVLVRASVSLAQGFVLKGEPDKGVTLLEKAREGTIETENGLWEKPDFYKCALNAPGLRLILLEELALVYQAAKRPEGAAKTWLDVYQLAQLQGTTLLVAESSQALGDHFLSVTDNVQAAKY